MRKFTQTEVEKIAKDFNFEFSASKDIDDDSMHYTITVHNNDLNILLDVLSKNNETKFEEAAVGIRNLTGKLLTLMEATLDNDTKLRATKDIIKSYVSNTLTELHNNIYPDTPAVTGLVINPEN